MVRMKPRPILPIIPTTGMLQLCEPPRNGTIVKRKNPAKLNVLRGFSEIFAPLAGCINGR